MKQRRGGLSSVRMDNANQIVRKEGRPNVSVDGRMTLRQEVSVIKDDIHEIINEAALAEKVELLRTTVNDLSEEVQAWRNGNNRSYVDSIMALQSQIAAIQEEWDTLFSTLRILWEKLEVLLERTPGIIESSRL